MTDKQSVVLTETGFVGYLLEAGATGICFTGRSSICRLTLRTAQRTVYNEYNTVKDIVGYKKTGLRAGHCF